jgi:hypothetical protein
MNMKTNWFRNSSLAAAAMTLLAVASLAQGTYHSNGVSNCNCTKSPAELQVCMTRTIEIEVSPGKFITITTGFSETNCATQTVPPGECIYYQYNATCSDHWYGWECKLTSTAVKSRKTNDNDCFTTP